VQRACAQFGFEIRHVRIRAGLSQREAGRKLGWSGTKISRIESAKLASLSFSDASRLAAILGLELAIRVFPSGEPIRDAAQAKRLMRLLNNVGPPLRWHADAPLPQRPGERPEMRAWDARIDGIGQQTAVELESRLTDVQELTRRHNLKRRDDPLDHFLLVVADTDHNRRVLTEYGSLLAGLPRLRTASVLKLLRAGRHPPTGFIVF
jgi:transcriptional regulator with XRE-family HTH domain